MSTQSTETGCEVCGERTTFHEDEKLFSKRDLLRFARYVGTTDPRHKFRMWFEAPDLPRYKRIRWIESR